MRTTPCDSSEHAVGRPRFGTIRNQWAGTVIAGALLCFSGIVCLASERDTSPVPKGLPPVPHPEDNPPSPEKIALGKQLFFDKRVSRGSKLACVNCHVPQKGYTDGKRFATGVTGKQGGRSAPSLINAAYNRFLFWDGREPSLEAQALGPIQNPIEMNMSLEDLVAKLKPIEGYRTQFQEVFGGEITPERIAKALAAFERTILSGDAPYDRFQAGDKTALSAAAQRGMKLFFAEANCSACHPGPNFTDNAFHNVGIGIDRKQPDVGREAISKLGGDRGSFKTPTLREVALTAPYMHDGSLKTLEEVIKHYDKGGTPNEWLDDEVFELELTEQEKADLATFLREGLSSHNYPMYKPPKLPN